MFSSNVPNENMIKKLQLCLCTKSCYKYNVTFVAMPNFSEVGKELYTYMLAKYPVHTMFSN